MSLSLGGELDPGLIWPRLGRADDDFGAVIPMRIRTLQILRWSPRACATCGHSSSSRAERDRSAEQVMRWILGMALFRGASIHDLVSRSPTTLQHARGRRARSCPPITA